MTASSNGEVRNGSTADDSWKVSQMADSALHVVNTTDRHHLLM
jgi:hypothetical protein